jgi:hypothetical protein
MEECAMCQAENVRLLGKGLRPVWTVALLLLLMVGIRPGQAEEVLPLVKDGEPVAVICSGAKPSTPTNLAIEAIQQRVERLAGVRLPVTTGAEAFSQKDRTLILVGALEENALLRGIAAETALNFQDAELGEEGFRLLTLTTKDGARCVLVAGAKPKGAYYAGCWLARRILAQGDLVCVRALDMKKRPALAVRGVYDAEWKSYGHQLKLIRRSDPCHPENMPWWKDYIDFLGAFGANHFEASAILTDPVSKRKGKDQTHLNWVKQISEYCRQRGMELHGTAGANSVRPQDLEDSPELRAEGVGKPNLVCPSKPGGTELLLRVHRGRIARAKDHIDGVVFYGYDSGGCNCKQCGGMHKDYYKTYMRLMNGYREMVREIDPRIKVAATLWFFNPGEKWKVLKDIEKWPHDLEIQADLWSGSPGAGYIRPLCQEHIDIMKELAPRRRLIYWDHETDMEPIMWLENPLPDRIGRRVELAKEAGCAGAVGFILSHPVKLINSAVLLQKAWDPSLTTEEVLREFARHMFASEDERIVQGIVYLGKWAELVGGLSDRTLKWAAPRSQPDREREWRTGLEYAQKARQLLAEAEGTARLGKDYYAYLKRLARINELICAKLLKQSQANEQLQNWASEAPAEAHAKLSAALDLLRQANEINQEIKQEMAYTRLAAVPSLADKGGYTGRLGNSIYNPKIIEGQIRLVEDWQEDVSLLGELQDRKGAWWNEQWNYRVKIVAAASHTNRSASDASLEDDFLAKCSVDFQRLLAAAGVPGRIDRASLRLVQYDQLGKAGSEVPFEFESDAGLPDEKAAAGTLYWSLSGGPGKDRGKLYYLYFDLPGHGPKPTPEPVKVLRDRLRDPSLESKAEWWTIRANARPPAVEFAWSNDAHTGKTAALLSLSEASGNHVLLTTNPRNNQAIAIKPGRTYRISFWYYVLSGKPRVHLDFVAYGGKVVDGKNVSPFLVADGEWHRSWLSLPSPEFSPGQTATLRFVAHYNPQRILIDDVEIQKEPVPLVFVADRAETRTH